jgi:hypothetical protein
MILKVTKQRHVQDSIHIPDEKSHSPCKDLKQRSLALALYRSAQSSVSSMACNESQVRKVVSSW